MSEKPALSEKAIAKKKKEFLRRKLEYEDTKNPLLVLDTIVEAVRYGLSLPKWALREQARINQAILRIGRGRRRHRDLGSEIARAMGLTKPGRGTAFSEEEHDSYLLFFGFLMARHRSAEKQRTGHLPSMVETYCDFAVEYDVSERTLRRARKRTQIHHELSARPRRGSSK